MSGMISPIDGNGGVRDLTSFYHKEKCEYKRVFLLFSKKGEYFYAFATIERRSAKL